MDSQDEIKIGHKAKRETEDFINRHLNDQAKGWPKVCFVGSAYADYRQEPQAASRENTRLLSAQ